MTSPTSLSDHLDFLYVRLIGLPLSEGLLRVALKNLMAPECTDVHGMLDQLVGSAGYTEVGIDKGASVTQIDKADLLARLARSAPSPLAAVALETLLDTDRLKNTSFTVTRSESSFLDVPDIVAARASEMSPYFHVDADASSNWRQWFMGELRAMVHAAIHATHVTQQREPSPEEETSVREMVRNMVSLSVRGDGPLATAANRGRLSEPLRALWTLSPIIGRYVERKDLVHLWSTSCAEGTRDQANAKHMYRADVALFAWTYPAAGDDSRVVDVAELKRSILTGYQTPSCVVMALLHAGERLRKLLGHSGLALWLESLDLETRLSALVEAGAAIRESLGDLELERQWLSVMGSLLEPPSKTSNSPASAKSHRAEMLLTLLRMPVTESFGVASLAADEPRREGLVHHTDGEVRAWGILHPDTIKWKGPEESEAFAAAHESEHSRRVRLYPPMDVVVRQRWR